MSLPIWVRLNMEPIIISLPFFEEGPPGLWLPYWRSHLLAQVNRRPLLPADLHMFLWSTHFMFICKTHSRGQKEFQHNAEIILQGGMWLLRSTHYIQCGYSHISVSSILTPVIALVS